jgi:spermidine/putrescine transport system substrate-binding protein
MPTPEVGGMFAAQTGDDSAVQGAAAHASEEDARRVNEVYAADLLDNMWWWQADTPFFAPLRKEFAEIIANACPPSRSTAPPRSTPRSPGPGRSAPSRRS